jgi:hypothetical protein
MLFIALLPFIAAYSVLQKASLITATLHFRASLRSTTFHFISPPFLSAFCSPPAALFGSPAGRYGLRLTLFICLHFVLAIKAVASCSALQTVMVLAEKATTTPAFRFHMCRPSPSCLRLIVHHPCSTRSGFADSSRRAQKKLHPMACPFSSWLL